MNIKPINGHVFVRLIDEYSGITTIEKQYATNTSGVIIATADDLTDIGLIVGKTGYWEAFKDSNTIKDGDKKYALIKYSDIGGLSE
jgi:co-chaperonin GroES (HSP10)